MFLIFLTVALVSCDNTSAKTYFAEASKYEHENKLKEAIALLDKAIARDENFIPAYINRGVDKSMLGDYQGAILDYSIVLKKQPQNTLALLNRAKNKNRSHDDNGAIQDLNAAIKTKGSELAYIDLKPNDLTDAGYDCSMEEIRLERGVSRYNIGDLKGAFSDMQFCLDRNFERKLALYWRSMIYISLNKKALGCKDLHEASALGNPNATAQLKIFCN